MKKILLTLLLFTIGFSAFSQKTEYTQTNNIHYYSDSAAMDQYANEKCVIDIYYPKNLKKFSTVIWFHGGGLTEGSKQIPSDLKDKNICIIGVGYRLSPKVKAPEFIKDAAAAVAWTFNNIEKFGGDKSKIFISGHSAGAYLASMVTLDKKWLSEYKIDADKIAGLISFSGQAITHFTIRKEKGIPATTPVIDEFAPLYFVRKDAPPTLLITGDRELELFGRYEENAYLMRMLKLVGHPDVKLLELQGYGHNMDKPAYPLLLKEIERINKNKLPAKR